MTALFEPNLFLRLAVYAELSDLGGLIEVNLT